jgi:hypothetical protein
MIVQGYVHNIKLLFVRLNLNILVGRCDAPDAMRPLFVVVRVVGSLLALVLDPRPRLMFRLSHRKSALQKLQPSNNTISPPSEPTIHQPGTRARRFKAQWSAKSARGFSFGRVSRYSGTLQGR